MRKQLGVSILTAMMVFVGGAVAAETPLVDPSDSVLKGSGRWGTSDHTARVQRWEIAAVNKEGSLEGTVKIVGSPLVGAGRIAGRVDGRGVWGTISDEQGQEVATFTGTVEDGGRMQGRYQARTGEVGTWEWDGPSGQ